MANTRREYRYRGLVNDIHVWDVLEPDGVEAYFYRSVSQEAARLSAYQKLQNLGFTDSEINAFSTPEFTKGIQNFVVQILNP